MDKTKNELDCDIIRDLMPSCVDGLASEKSKAAVEEHIESCKSCKNAFLSMKAPERRLDEAEAAEIDYLKKLKKSSKKKVVVTAVILIFVVALALILRTVYPGKATYYDNISTELSFENGKLLYSVSSMNEKECVTRVDVSEKNGEILLTVFCAPRSPLGKKSFAGEYNFSQTGDFSLGAVKVNGNTVWENGYYTDSTEYMLFKHKTPYCGDIVTDIKIAEAVGVSSDLGSFTNELSTVNKPYEWRIFLKNEVEDESRCKKLMKNKACAILACIENLDSITFVYKTEKKEKRFTVDCAVAGSYVGADIKDCSGSVEKIRNLLDRLEIE